MRRCNLGITQSDSSLELLNLGEVMSTVENTPSAKSFEADPNAWSKNTHAYRCHILLTKDDDGGYSAVVLNLPGAGSCGDTEEEAIENVREAICGVVESYIADNEEIPWIDSLARSIPEHAKQLWILVHV